MTLWQSCGISATCLDSRSIDPPTNLFLAPSQAQKLDLKILRPSCEAFPFLTIQTILLCMTITLTLKRKSLTVTGQDLVSKPSKPQLGSFALQKISLLFTLEHTTTLLVQEKQQQALRLQAGCPNTPSGCLVHTVRCLTVLCKPRTTLLNAWKIVLDAWNSLLAFPSKTLPSL